MYEGPIQAAEFAASEESPILRQLRWSDLVARIAATRQIRPEVAVPVDEAQASFAAFQRDGSGEGQRPINRDALAHGKLTRVATPDAAHNRGDGDREIP